MARPRGAAAERERVMSGVVAHRDELLARIVARARTEFEGYLRFDDVDLAPGAGAILDLMLLALSQGRGPNGEELGHYRAYGRERAEMGIPLNEVLGVWRMSSREILGELASVARVDRVSDDLLLALTNELLDTFDVAIRAYTIGHQEIELARAGREHQRRSEFVRRLLLGTRGSTSVEREAREVGIDGAADLIAFRSRPSEAGAAPWIDRETLVTSIDGDIAGVLPARPPGEVSVAVGIGEGRPLAQLSDSFRQATTCLETAIAFGLRGVFDLDRLGLLPAVVADRELGDRLVRRYLEPLGVGSTAALLRETLECYLQNGQRVEGTASAMFVHQNTVRYRLSRFFELTGTDLRSSAAAFELWWALQRFKLTV